MYDVQSFIKAYPDWSRPTNEIDFILGAIFFSMLFLIPYLYVRFLEARLVSFITNRLIPFMMFRLHLEKPAAFLKNILGFQIFRAPKAKI